MTAAENREKCRNNREGLCSIVGALGEHRMNITGIILCEILYTFGVNRDRHSDGVLMRDTALKRDV